MLRAGFLYSRVLTLHLQAVFFQALLLGYDRALDIISLFYWSNAVVRPEIAPNLLAGSPYWLWVLVFCFLDFNGSIGGKPAWFSIRRKTRTLAQLQKLEAPHAGQSGSLAPGPSAHLLRFQAATCASVVGKSSCSGSSGWMWNSVSAPPELPWAQAVLCVQHSSCDTPGVARKWKD